MKWIIRDGLNGISRAGSGASIARGLKKSRGLRKSGLLGGLGGVRDGSDSKPYRLGASDSLELRRATIRRRPMSETHPVETDQAAREASGAHPYGRYLEEFEVGAVYKHWPAKTVTESDDHLFCLITMNHHPLHLNDVYAHKSQQGRNVVVGPLVYSLALGMSVSRRQRQGDREPCDRRAQAPRTGVPRRHALLRVRGAGEARVPVQARPRHGEGAHARAEPGRRAGGRVQAPRARTPRTPRSSARRVASASAMPGAERQRRFRGAIGFSDRPQRAFFRSRSQSWPGSASRTTARRSRPRYRGAAWIS